jgi:hypothetical protein
MPTPAKLSVFIRSACCQVVLRIRDHLQRTVAKLDRVRRLYVNERALRVLLPWC